MEFWMKSVTKMLHTIIRML